MGSYVNPADVTQLNA